jgi:hypothetical protein
VPVHNTHNLCWKDRPGAGRCSRRRLARHLRARASPRGRPQCGSLARRTADRGARSATGSGCAAPGATEADRWASLVHLEWCASRCRVPPGCAGDDGRQSQEFHEHDVEYGYMYESSAVVPDGTPPHPSTAIRKRGRGGMELTFVQLRIAVLCQPPCVVRQLGAAAIPADGRPDLCLCQRDASGPQLDAVAPVRHGRAWRR